MESKDLNEEEELARSHYSPNIQDPGHHKSNTSRITSERLLEYDKADLISKGKPAEYSSNV